MLASHPIVAMVPTVVRVPGRCTRHSWVAAITVITQWLALEGNALQVLVDMLQVAGGVT